MTIPRKFKRPFRSKKDFKTVAGACHICGEDNPALLDTHRIHEGKDGGKYSWDNVVCCCTSCHRKQQAGQVKILGWFNSTMGRVLHVIDDQGDRFI